MITGLSAVTLATHDMRQAVRFYTLAGFDLLYGGETATFTSLRAGPQQYLNLVAAPPPPPFPPPQAGEGEGGGAAPPGRQWWGRIIFYDDDVDALHARFVEAGYRPQAAPRDATWGERFFHIADPDGHELSFAWPHKKTELSR